MKIKVNDVGGEAESACAAPAGAVGEAARRSASLPGTAISGNVQRGSPTPSPSRSLAPKIPRTPLSFITHPEARTKLESLPSPPTPKSTCPLHSKPNPRLGALSPPSSSSVPEHRSPLATTSSSSDSKHREREYSSGMLCLQYPVPDLGNRGRLP